MPPFANLKFQMSRVNQFRLVLYFVNPIFPLRQLLVGLVRAMGCNKHFANSFREYPNKTFPIKGQNLGVVSCFDKRVLAGLY